LWKYDEVGHTQDAKRELNKYVNYEETENTLNSVKPVNLIRRMIQIGTSADDDIVLDFFGGSGPTAHAVIQESLRDNVNRRFILVQLPEPLPKPEKQLKTLADFARSRILNVISENKPELDAPNPKLLGFRMFSLGSSNFRTWPGDISETNELQNQLTLHVDHIKADSSAEDILYELLLKAGFALTTKVKKVTLAGKEVFSIEDGALLVCLEKEVTPELLDALAEAEPLQVICLDAAFNGNDQLKANAVQTFRARTHAEESEIVFRTV
jgi:adenine-specific DNA-methyltransferase